MAEVELMQYCNIRHRKESKSESKKKISVIYRIFTSICSDMPYITKLKRPAKMKISVEDAEKIITEMQRKRIVRKGLYLTLSRM